MEKKIVADGIEMQGLIPSKIKTKCKKFFVGFFDVLSISS